MKEEKEIAGPRQESEEVAELMRVTGKMEELLRLAMEAEKEAHRVQDGVQSSASSTFVTSSEMSKLPKPVGCA